MGIGMCNGGNLPSLYVSLRVGVRRRSEAMLYMTAMATFGCAVGPAMGSALNAFLVSIRIHNLVLDSDTAPGWFMAAAYLLFMAKLILLFEDLPVQVTARKPRIQLGSAGSDGERFPIVASCATFWYSFMSAIVITMTEVYTVNVAQHEFGCSIAKSGLMVAAIMLISCLGTMVIGKLTPRLLQSDRAGILGSCFLGSLACVLLFAISWDVAVEAQVVLLGVGLVLIITLVGLVRSFGLALCSKLAPAHLKTCMNSWSIIFLTLGRGSGAVIGMVLQPGVFAFVISSIFAFSLFLSLVLYSWLKVGAKAN